MNVQDCLGDTPLTLAVPTRVNIDMVRLLISKGANIHLKNKRGETALKIAEFYKYEDIIKILKSAEHQITQ